MSIIAQALICRTVVPERVGPDEISTTPGGVGDGRPGTRSRAPNPRLLHVYSLV